MVYQVNGPQKIKIIDKRILDCLRIYENRPANGYFLLAEKMMISCQRKKDRGEEFKNTFEFLLLENLVTYLDSIDKLLGLRDPLVKLNPNFDNFLKE